MNAPEIHFADQMQAITDKHLDGLIETAREGIRHERDGSIDPSVNLAEMAAIFAEIELKLGSGYLLASAIRRLALVAEDSPK